MLPVIMHLFYIQLSHNLHLKTRQWKGKEIRGGRGNVCVYMSFVKVGMKRKSVYACGHMFKEITALPSLIAFVL